MFQIFPYVFSNVFNAIASNTNIIEDMVDGILNSNVFQDMVNDLESMLNPSINFNEDSTAYTIQANLPGIRKKDINLDYTNNYITLEIKRNEVFSNGKNVTVAIMQQGGNLVKDFYVGNIDPYKINAVFKDEFLNVYIPKKTLIDEDSIIIDVVDYVSE